MKKILVMLSSYNGEQYIEQQIESILWQKDVDITLQIRDDGSNDNTWNLINEFAKRDSRIQVFRGNNLGFRRSFYELLLRADCNFDYYAFSDQDDVWDNDKLSCAINKLEEIKENIKLYASGLRVVDQNLNYMYDNNFDGIKIGYGSALTRQRLAGCTMVFSKELLLQCKRFKITEDMGNLFSHDAAVYYICLACGGAICFEKEGHINFRRHSGTVTEHGKGLLKRISSVINIFGTFRDRRFLQAKVLYEIYQEEMPEDILNLSEKIIHYRDSIKKTIELLFVSELNSNIKIVDFVNKIAILFRYY